MFGDDGLIVHFMIVGADYDEPRVGIAVDDLTLCIRQFDRNKNAASKSTGTKSAAVCRYRRYPQISQPLR
jgi:hypothetical protein